MHSCDVKNERIKVMLMMCECAIKLDRKTFLSLRRIFHCFCVLVCVCAFVGSSAIQYFVKIPNADFRVYAMKIKSSKCADWLPTLHNAISEKILFYFFLPLFPCDLLLELNFFVFVPVYSECRPRLQPIKTIGRIIGKKRIVFIDCVCKLYEIASHRLK